MDNETKNIRATLDRWLDRAVAVLNKQGDVPSAELEPVRSGLAKAIGRAEGSGYVGQKLGNARIRLYCIDRLLANKKD